MRTFYGDPDDTDWDDMMADGKDGPPEDGDELCDGHQMHYIWKNGKWS